MWRNRDEYFLGVGGHDGNRLIGPEKLCWMELVIPLWSMIHQISCRGWVTKVASGPSGQVVNLGSPQPLLPRTNRLCSITLTIVHKAKERNAIRVECVGQALQRASRILVHTILAYFWPIPPGLQRSRCEAEEATEPRSLRNTTATTTQLLLLHYKYVLSTLQVVSRATRATQRARSG